MNKWRNPNEADYVCGGGDICLVLCRVTGDNPHADKSAIVHEPDLYVSTGDKAPGETFVSVGFWNPDSAEDEFHTPDGWHVAGYVMDQDSWASARGFEVIGWRPAHADGTID